MKKSCCDRIVMNCNSVWSYIQWITSLTIHAIRSIALMGVEIQRATNGHCNSKIELQA